MRLAPVLVVSLVLLGSSAALSVPLAPTDRVAELRGSTDALIERLGLARSVASAIDEGLALGGFEPAPFAAVHSESLETAIRRAYEASGIAVDDALRARIATQSAAAESPALVELFDAFADAQFASALVLSEQDRALLSEDLATTMKLVTLVGSAQRPVPAEWRAMYEERMAILSRADVPMAAAAAVRLSQAIPHLADLAPAEGCSRVLDLPFFQVGAPCDDVYAADVLNLVQIDYGGDDQYYNGAGSGIAGAGVGLHIDYGEGADLYQAVTSSQAFAIAGVAILYDEGGADHYSLTVFGQGFSAAGVAILYDGGVADDIYESPTAPDTLGTKGGSLGGVGILVDEGGSDLYQQDGLDGFVYGAQGVGLLLEFGSGNDRYVTNDNHIILAVPGLPPEDLGFFAGPVQVSAEVNGVAILYEEGGDDSYSCGQHVRQGCQGAGGVGAFSALLDLAGNDVYALGEAITPLQEDILPVFPSGQGVAYGEGSAPPGPGIGILRDLAGDDAYVADKYAQGYATGGLGLLFDEAGADTYANALAALVGDRGDGQTWADGLALGIGIDEA